MTPRNGNDLLWTLYRLNNIEKHRLLLAVGAQAAGVHLGQMLAAELRRGSGFPAEAREPIEQMTAFLNPADKGSPLEDGFELLIPNP